MSGEEIPAPAISTERETEPRSVNVLERETSEASGVTTGRVKDDAEGFTKEEEEKRTDLVAASETLKNFLTVNRSSEETTGFTGETSELTTAA